MPMFNIYKDALYKSTIAFAYHEAVLGENGIMIDYRFLDVNPAFEQATGLKRERILGKCFASDVANNKEEGQRWVDIYRKVLYSENETISEEYSRELLGNYFIHAYKTDEHHFVTLFRNTNNEQKMEAITSYFLEHVGKRIDYQLLTQMGLEFSGADYAIFSLYDGNKYFVTKAVVGLPEKLDKVLKMLKIKIVGKKWRPVAGNLGINQRTNIMEFDELSVLVGNAIPKVLVKQIQSMFKIGKVVVAEIRKDQKILGNFTLIFENTNPFYNSMYLNIYLKQLGVFIDKCHLEKSLIQKKQEAEVLAHKIRKDTLTNSYNRTVINTLLTDRLIISSRNKIKCYIVILDVDNFKFINDNYGHQIGDTILQMFVDRVNSTLRGSDLLVRVGGDEFLLYLENIDTDEHAKTIMQRLFSAISAPYSIFDEDTDSEIAIDVSLSAGVARFPSDGTTIKELMNKADYTMYRVKKSGKNDFAFFALDKDLL